VKPKAILFSGFAVLIIVILIFGFFIFNKLGKLEAIDESIENAERIRIAALDFNVENFHTQLEVWEYAYDPTQKRLAAFEGHEATLISLLDDLEESVKDSDTASVYERGRSDLNEIIGNMGLVQRDWLDVISAVGDYEIARDSGAVMADLVELDSIALKAVNDNEELFDSLNFNKDVDEFVEKQGGYIERFEDEKHAILSSFKTTIYMLVIVEIIFGLIIAFIISNAMGKSGSDSTVN